MATAPALIKLLQTGSAVQRLDAAGALEKLSRYHLSELVAYQDDVLALIRTESQASVQWHFAELLPRLQLTEKVAAEMAQLMSQWIAQSASSIVKADALSALCFLALQHAAIMPQAKLALARALKLGTPAERARARKLIGRVQPAED